MLADRAMEGGRALFITLKTIYEAFWLWLPLLLVGGILGYNCHQRAVRLVLKTTYWYLFLLITLFLLGTANIPVRDLFLDLTSRIYLLVQSAELLFIEWGNVPLAPLGAGNAAAQPQQGAQGEKPQVARSAQAAAATMPHTYKMRIVYCITSLLYLAWLLLGVGFSIARLTLPGR